MINVSIGKNIQKELGSSYKLHYRGTLDECWQLHIVFALNTHVEWTSGINRKVACISGENGVIQKKKKSKQQQHEQQKPEKKSLQY